MEVLRNMQSRQYDKNEAYQQQRAKDLIEFIASVVDIASKLVRLTLQPSVRPRGVAEMMTLELGKVFKHFLAWLKIMISGLHVI